MFGSVLPAAESMGVSTSSTSRSAKIQAEQRVQRGAQAQRFDQRRGRQRSSHRAVVRAVVGATQVATGRHQNAASIATRVAPTTVGTAAHSYLPKKSSNCASSQISTPNSCALASLEPGGFARDHEAGLLRHAAGHLGAQRFELCARLVAAHGGKAAGQHHGLAVERSGRNGPRCREPAPAGQRWLRCRAAAARRCRNVPARRRMRSPIPPADPRSRSCALAHPPMPGPWRNRHRPICSARMRVILGISRSDQQRRQIQAIAQFGGRCMGIGNFRLRDPADRR